jgi:hypothetical protein
MSEHSKTQPSSTSHPQSGHWPEFRPLACAPAAANVTPENVDAYIAELVVYANSITRTETDAKGEETEREIPYMKGYTVFNAAHCDGLPAHYTAKAEPPGHTTVITDTFDGEEAEDEEPGPTVVEPPTDERILIRWRSSRGRRASGL